MLHRRIVSRAFRNAQSIVVVEVRLHITIKVGIVYSKFERSLSSIKGSKRIAGMFVNDAYRLVGIWLTNAVKEGFRECTRLR